ncbi:MAG: hypothetical protein ACRETW_04375, partial [Stenotrophobium sp.]
GWLDSQSVSCAAAPVQICARESKASAPAQCSRAQMAAYDKFAAVCGLPNDSGGRSGGITDVIPGGRIWTECLDSTGAIKSCESGMRIRIRVSWSERQSADVGGAVQTQAIDMVIQP